MFAWVTGAVLYRSSMSGEAAQSLNKYAPVLSLGSQAAILSFKAFGRSPATATAPWAGEVCEWVLS